jgi:retinol dehydrogenase-12
LDLLLDGTTDFHSPISAILQQYRRLTKMAAAISSFFRQSAWIPNPELTEKNLPNQAGRVFIVTGGYAGIGYELSKILYKHDGTVYVAGRSQEKGDKAIASIREAVPNSKGKLEFMHIDLADLTTIKPGVEKFLSQESRLDVLTNNAGVCILIPDCRGMIANGEYRS